SILWPRLGALAWPVGLYVAAILAMALAAWNQPGLAIPVGATLFVISDALIAGGRFLALGPWTAQAIWATYALAQILIVLGLTTANNRV
ncbi:MAG: lysoplasmalogenase family protein, partial [Niveispirillum sp.]|uniref:lysoplasmalogenase family protein n=1 Tax=Niveispirillum sp. TaxID=1917217 RepID=UPI004036B28E